jgi:two-component system, sensor histidine kinase
VREAMLLSLELEGFDAIGAASARTAEELFRREGDQVQLLISDYHLGDAKSGREVVESLRGIAARELPAVFLSGDTSFALRSLQNLPRTRTLNKPVDVHELVQTIAQLLAAH